MRKVAIVIGCVLYLLSPIDVIPDPLLGPGQLDDLGVLALSVRALLKKVEKKQPPWAQIGPGATGPHGGQR